MPRKMTVTGIKDGVFEAGMVMMEMKVVKMVTKTVPREAKMRVGAAAIRTGRYGTETTIDDNSA